MRGEQFKQEKFGERPETFLERLRNNKEKVIGLTLLAFLTPIMAKAAETGVKSIKPEEGKKYEDTTRETRTTQELSEGLTEKEEPTVVEWKDLCNQLEKRAEEKVEPPEEVDTDSLANAVQEETNKLLPEGQKIDSDEVKKGIKEMLDKPIPPVEEEKAQPEKKEVTPEKYTVNLNENINEEDLRKMFEELGINYPTYEKRGPGGKVEIIENEKYFNGYFKIPKNAEGGSTEVEIIPWDNVNDSGFDLLRKLKEQGYRPLNFHEMIQLLHQHPELKAKPLTSLGTLRTGFIPPIFLYKKAAAIGYFSYEKGPDGKKHPRLEITDYGVQRQESYPVNYGVPVVRK